MAFVQKVMQAGVASDKNKRKRTRLIFDSSQEDEPETTEEPDESPRRSPTPSAHVSPPPSANPSRELIEVIDQDARILSTYSICMASLSHASLTRCL